MSAFCPHGYTPGPNHPCLFCRGESDLRAALARAEERCARLRKALERVQWNAGNAVDQCGYCWRSIFKDRGHAEQCIVRSALAADEGGVP